jgi:uncharacterized protein (TIGR00661 family)
MDINTATPRILIAPLNWGMGHATRCIPIIQYMLDKGAEVIIASDGSALNLLKAEFPDLNAVEIPSYNVQYKRNNMVVNLGLQLPRIAMTVYKEQKWLNTYLKDHAIDAIISDNRFGLFTKRVPTVFISHQINIPIPVQLLFKLGNYINHYFIRKFEELWIPDFEQEPSLTGSMAHNTPLDYQASYLGPISRMAPAEEEKKYDLCVVLSGPEPQRTRLEHILLTQLANLPYNTILVRGIPHHYQRIKCSDKLEMVTFMKGDELNQTILQSELIISRSGYTTIMDLAVLGKKALFIPTPGQKEQEDLAKHFKENGIYHSVDQIDVELSNDIPTALTFQGLQVENQLNATMKKVVDEWFRINGFTARIHQDNIQKGQTTQKIQSSKVK